MAGRGENRNGVGRGKKFWTAQNLAHGQPWAAHVLKTCNTREAHVIIRVPAVIKIWGDAVRRESLGVCHGQSTVIGRVLRVGITRNSVCLAAYHWHMDFSVLRQCLGSVSAVEQPPTAIPRTKYGQAKNCPNITTYDHVHQIFITFCTWFSRGVLCDRGFKYKGICMPIESWPCFCLICVRDWYRHLG